MPTFAELTLPEFDDEMARTRLVLASIPSDKLEWKLDESFQSIGWNATHIANIVGWTTGIIAEDFFDIAPQDGPADSVEPLDNLESILLEFDTNVVAARQAISRASDELLSKEWSLLMGGQTLFTMTKQSSIRKWVLNHLIHHRGILSIQLRKCGVSLTPVYDA